MGFFDDLWDGLKSIADGADEVFRDVGKIAGDIVEGAGTVLGDVTEGVCTVVGETVGLVSDDAEKVVKNVGKSASNIANTVTKVASGAIKTGVGVVSGVGSTIRGDDDGADKAQDLARSGLDNLSDSVDHVKASSKSARAAFVGVANLAGDAIEGTGKLAGAALEGTGKIAGMAAGLVDERSEAVLANLGKTASGVVQTPTRMTSAGVKLGVGIVAGVEAIIEGDDDGAEYASEVARSGIDSVNEWAEETTEAATEATKHLTGEKAYELAKREYDRLVDENKAKHKELSSARREAVKAINERLEELNGCKVKAKEQYACVRKLLKIAASHDVHLKPRANFDEMYIARPVRQAPIKTAKDIFADVDFDNNPIWNSFKGVITVGVWTVSQVEYARADIRRQRRAAKDKWAQDEKENMRYPKMAASLDEVCTDFAYLLDVQAKLTGKVSDLAEKGDSRLFDALRALLDATESIAGFCKRKYLVADGKKLDIDIKDVKALHRERMEAAKKYAA